MMVWSIHLFVLSLGFLIVGMFKPKWLLFWMDQPKRMPIVVFSGFLFMLGATMFGEANRQQKQQAQPVEVKPDTAPNTETKEHL